MKTKIEVKTIESYGMTIASCYVDWTKDKYIRRCMDNPVTRTATFEVLEKFGHKEKLVEKVRTRQDDTFDKELGEKLAKTKLKSKYHNKILKFANAIAKIVSRQLDEYNVLMTKNAIEFNRFEQEFSILRGDIPEIEFIEVKGEIV